jgi:hypothetical protein
VLTLVALGKRLARQRTLPYSKAKEPPAEWAWRCLETPEKIFSYLQW